VVRSAFMAKYLVTGIAGFIGSAIARELLKRGEDVRGIDNLSTGKWENIAEIATLIDFRHADLLDERAVESACKGVDYVFHEAAIPSVPKSVLDPVSSHNANITGTLNVLIGARAAGVKRVLYASSSSLYGDTPTLPKYEAMKADPISPYAVQKIAGEMYMISFTRVYGLQTVSLRYFNVFGPRQDPTSPYSGVLSLFSSKMLAGEAPTIFGDGEQSRDFTYVDNVVHGNLLACHAPAELVSGRAFNLACGRVVTLNQTYAIMQQFTGFRSKPLYKEPRTGDIKHSLADIREAKRCFGYEPQVTFEDGLGRTVEWYREQQKDVAVSSAHK
jgi:nucleoside-diphosphate-sugar epimerase